MNLSFSRLTIVSIVSLALSIVSCSKKDREYIGEGMYTTVNAELYPVELDENTMYPMDLILLSDSLLVVKEAKKTNGFLTVYNLKTQQAAAELGVIGDGPDDFINPRIINDMTTNNSFIIGDSKKLVRFSSGLITKKDYSGEKILSLPSEMLLYNYILINNDSMIVYSQTGEHPISIFYKGPASVEYIDYFPDIDWPGGSEFIRNMEVFDKCITSNGKDVAIAYHNWNTISIITPEGNVKKEINFPEWDYNNDKMQIDSSTENLDFDKDAKIFFTKIRSNAKYIYALGWAATNEQIKNEIAKPYIYVINWDGNVVKKLIFDKSVTNFCIYNDSIPYVSAIGEDGEIHVFGCKLN